MMTPLERSRPDPGSSTQCATDWPAGTGPAPNFAPSISQWRGSVHSPSCQDVFEVSDHLPANPPDRCCRHHVMGWEMRRQVAPRLRTGTVGYNAFHTDFGI